MKIVRCFKWLHIFFLVYLWIYFPKRSESWCHLYCKKSKAASPFQTRALGQSPTFTPLLLWPSGLFLHSTPGIRKSSFCDVFLLGTVPLWNVDTRWFLIKIKTDRAWNLDSNSLIPYLSRDLQCFQHLYLTSWNHWVCISNLQRLFFPNI